MPGDSVPPRALGFLASGPSSSSFQCLPLLVPGVISRARRGTEQESVRRESTLSCLDQVGFALESPSAPRAQTRLVRPVLSMCLT